MTYVQHADNCTVSKTCAQPAPDHARPVQQKTSHTAKPPEAALSTVTVLCDTVHMPCQLQCADIQQRLAISLVVRSESPCETLPNNRRRIHKGLQCLKPPGPGPQKPAAPAKHGPLWKRVTHTQYKQSTQPNNTKSPREEAYSRPNWWARHGMRVKKQPESDKLKHAQLWQEMTQLPCRPQGT